MNEIKNWYAGLNQRESTMVKLLGISLVVLLVFVLIVMPLKSYHGNLIADRDSMMSQASSVKQQVSVLSASGVGSGSSLPLEKLINQSSKKYGLKFSSIQEKQRNKEIQLRIDDAEFDQFIRWISELEQKNGLIIEKLNVSNTDSIGRVDISLKILRAG